MRSCATFACVSRKSWPCPIGIDSSTGLHTFVRASVGEHAVALLGKDWARLLSHAVLTVSSSCT